MVELAGQERQASGGGDQRGRGESVPVPGWAEALRQQRQNQVPAGEQGAEGERRLALVQVEEDVEDREEDDLQEHRRRIHVEQAQVQRRDARCAQHRRPRDEDQHHRHSLHLDDLGQAAADAADHAVLDPREPIEGRSVADAAEEFLAAVREIRLQAEEERRHGRDRREVGEEDGQIVDDGVAKGTEHRFRGPGVEPEGRLVRPDAEIEDGADGRELVMRLARIEEVEAQPSFAGKCAQDQGEHPEQRSGLPDEKACQQTLETKGPQYRRASDRSEIGGEEQGRHRPVRLHTREQHQQEPAVAEHDEVRDQEQAASERLVECGVHHGRCERAAGERRDRERGE